MKNIRKKFSLAIILVAVSVPAYAVLGNLTSEQFTSSGKVCYYDLGNGVTKSITIGKSEMYPQTHNF